MHTSQGNTHTYNVIPRKKGSTLEINASKPYQVIHCINLARISQINKNDFKNHVTRIKYSESRILY